MFQINRFLRVLDPNLDRLSAPVVIETTATNETSDGAGNTDVADLVACQRKIAVGIMRSNPPTAFPRVSTQPAENKRTTSAAKITFRIIGRFIQLDNVKGMARRWEALNLIKRLSRRRHLWLVYAHHGLKPKGVQVLCL